MRTTNAEFWGELTGGLELNANQLPKPDETISEDIEPDVSLEDNDADDSDLSIQTLINVMVKNDLPAGVGTRKSGALTSIAEAENPDNVDMISSSLEPVGCGEELIVRENSVVESQTHREKQEVVMVTVEGRGMRKKMANKLYEKFWRHNDDDGSDDDTVFP